MKKTSILCAVFLLAAAGSALAAKPAPSLLPHADKISVYGGPQTCLSCHGDAVAEEVFSSVHFQVRSSAPKVDMPGGGSHGMLDRACGLPGTTLMADNFAGQAVSPLDGATVKDDGCGVCHIAYRPPSAYPTAAQAAPDMDCLICHALAYGEEWTHSEVIKVYGDNPEAEGRHVIRLGDGTESWSQDRSLKTAQSVGKPVTTEACLRCHEHGLSGYKRSTPFTAEEDVHAARGMTCSTCHAVSAHKIARGNYVTDGVANDRPEVEVGCVATVCHGSAPHTLTPDLNRHSSNVTCEVCHIHSMDEPRNIYRRAWAPFTLDPVSGQWQATPPTTSGLEYPGFWDAYTEYHPIGTRPTIRWFNGGASMLAQPYGSYADRRSAGGDSRLFSFKPFVSGMLFDAGWLPGPSSNPTFDMVSGTWPFSMKSFYEQNWATFVAYGFIDAKYATPAAYWQERPDMAAMLNNFPMMLQFDRSIFLSEAGTVLGSPLPGPQTAATYPGIVKAINQGMGRMAIDLGYFPAETNPQEAGTAMWSGGFFGMWVPPNMDQTSPFFGEVVSFITLSHAVKSNLSYDSIACFACHYTAEEYAGTAAPSNKYLDFLKLQYPDLDGNGLADPLYDRIAAPAEICSDGVDNDSDGLLDCADPDCATECPSGVETACGDGLDNDGDGLVDCADGDCAGLTGCGPEGDSATCSDGIDNDGDGAIDCADPGCAKNRVCR